MPFNDFGGRVQGLDEDVNKGSERALIFIEFPVWISNPLTLDTRN